MTARRPPAEPAQAGEKPIKHISTNATIAVFVIIVLVLYFVRLILLPFVIAGIIAYVCTPLVDILARRLRLPRALAAFGVGLALAAVAGFIGYLAWPLFMHELGRGARELGDLRGLVHRWIGGNSVSLFGKTMSDAEIAGAVSGAAQSWLNHLGGLPGLFAIGFAGVFAWLLAWALLFYFLIGGEEIARGILWLFPPLDRHLVERIWHELDPILRRYFIGLAIVVVYASSMAYIGLGLVLRTPHAPVLAPLTGVLELVPIAGPLGSAVIAGIFTIHGANGPGVILGYIVYATLLRLSIDQLIGPIVLGRAARIQPSVVIFCFLAGAILFGVPGVILAVPVALTIKVSVSVLYDEPLEISRKRRRR